MQTIKSKCVQVLIDAEGPQRGIYKDENGTSRIAAGITYLTPAETEWIISRRCAEIHGELRFALPWFDDAPDDVQFAAVAIVHHIGALGLVVNSPCVQEKAHTGDWDAVRACLLGLTTPQHAERLAKTLSWSLPHAAGTDA